MASKFKIGDLVWAKMKGFPAWPGKVIDPKSDKKNTGKIRKHYVFFYGSENYAWIPEESIWSYVTNKEKFVLTSRVPKGFKEAVESIEDVIKHLPPAQPPVKSPTLPTIEDEIAVIFSGKEDSKGGKGVIRKDYTREPLSSRGKPGKAQDKPSKQENLALSRAKGAESKRRNSLTQPPASGNKSKRNPQQSGPKLVNGASSDSELIASRAENNAAKFTSVKKARRVTRSLADLPVRGKVEDVKTGHSPRVKRRASEDYNKEPSCTDSKGGRSKSSDAAAATSKPTIDYIAILKERLKPNISARKSVSEDEKSDLKSSSNPVHEGGDSETERKLGKSVSDALEKSGASSDDLFNESANKTLSPGSSTSNRDGTPQSKHVTYCDNDSSIYNFDDGREASPQIPLSSSHDLKTYSRSHAKNRSSFGSSPGGRTDNSWNDSSDIPDSTKTEKEEQSRDRSSAVTDKKSKEKDKSTPKSVSKKRPSSPHTSSTSKKSRFLIKSSPPTTKHSQLNSSGINSSSAFNSNHEKVGSSTITASASSTSTPQPKEIQGYDGWNSSNTFRKDSPLFERYDRILDPSMVEPILSKSIIPTPLKIGFLGLGIMGSGMVSNLLKSGHEVTVWNRTPSKCRDFIKEGALKGNSPSEVVQLCDITLSSVADPTALKDLVFGNCGVLQGISQGKAYVDMSTVDVETITDVHEAVTARGGRFLEAPVIGSKQPATYGNLLILAAGDRSLYDDCYSCFEAMGKRTFYLGEIGSAAKMKLVLNLFMGTMIAGLAESLALAEKVGLDQEEVLQILDLSPVSCPLVKSKGHAMISNNYSDPHCKLHTYQKDLRLSVNMSDTVDQPLHVGSAVNELFKKAKAKGYGEHDTAAVYRAADL